MSEAREAVLAAVREACAIGRSSTSCERPERIPGTPESYPAPLERFTDQLERLGVHVHRAADEDQAANQIALVADQVGAAEVARSDCGLVRRLTDGLPQPVFDGWSDRERLFEAGLGVTGVQAAIAETGTLMLASADEFHRLTSLVPPVHLAVVRTDQVLNDMDQALARAAQKGLPPLITFISGPSRTADIELTLVVGVHGPRELHVVILG